MWLRKVIGSLITVLSSSILSCKVQLFSYLSDKDLFSDIFRHLLAKRLLNQKSANDDAEKSIIGKFKLKCGAQFTYKMEGMLNDLSTGKDHVENFKRLPKKTNLDLICVVLISLYKS